MTAVQEHAAPVPAASQTLLKELIRRRHWEYEKFAAEYQKATARTGEHRWAPSRAQYYRWTSGQLKRGIPYPGACRTLEAMFIPWTAAELFGPCPEVILRAAPCPKTLVSPGPGLDQQPGDRAVALALPGTGLRMAAAGQVAAARLVLSLTHAQFAAKLSPAIGWLPGPDEVREWEHGTAVPPGDVVLFAQACLKACLAGAR